MPEVRLIGEDGEKVGVVSIEEALGEAQRQGLDLVEVAAQADPPVCRVMDYKKFQYEKDRKKKEARKQQRQVDTKEVKLRPAIDEHDYQTKLNHLRKFLQKGNKVKITLMFRRREMRRYEVGVEVVDRMVKDASDIATEDPGSRTRGRIISLMMSPKKEVMAEAERQFKEELKQRKQEHDRKMERKHGHLDGQDLSVAAEQSQEEEEPVT